MADKRGVEVVRGEGQLSGAKEITVQTDTAGVYSINLGSGQWTVSVSDLDYEFSPAQKVYNVNVASGLLERIE